MNLTSSLTACRHSNESSLQTSPPHNGPRWNVTKIPPCLDCFRHWTLDFHTICLGMSKNWFSTTVLGWGCWGGNFWAFSILRVSKLKLLRSAFDIGNSGIHPPWNSAFILKKGCEAKKQATVWKFAMRLPFCCSYISTYIWAIQKINP